MREKELFDWRKKVSEVECRLTQQENLLECAVKERNLYSRSLIEAQVQLVRQSGSVSSKFLITAVMFSTASVLIGVPEGFRSACYTKHEE